MSREGSQVGYFLALTPYRKKVMITEPQIVERRRIFQR